MNIAWPHDDNESLIKFYGEPGTVHLLDFVPPWKMIDADTKQPVLSFKVHPKCLHAFDKVFREIWDECHHDQDYAQHYHLHLFGGCYNKRFVRGSTSHWSVHAFAAAIDINPEGAPLAVDRRPSHENMPDFAVNAFKKQGATWGGDFVHRKDWMHFQFVYEAKKTYSNDDITIISNNVTIVSNSVHDPAIVVPTVITPNGAAIVPPVEEKPGVENESSESFVERVWDELKKDKFA